MEAQLVEQQGEIEGLREGGGGGGGGAGGGEGGGRVAEAEAEVAAQRAKCDNLVKERKAIKTILENKVKVLVNSVAQSAHTVLNDSQTTTESSQGHALTKDLAALKRLVHAAVTALANADEQHQR
jgi:hypothetical protein